MGDLALHSAMYVRLETKKKTFFPRSTTSFFFPVDYLTFRNVDCKVFSKAPKIVMVHVHHCPQEGSDLDV